MKLDNSQMKTWFQCPWMWREKYLNKIERKVKSSDALAFGKRMHHMLERHLVGREPDVAVSEFEDEAQAMYALYCAKYPVEAFDVIGSEILFDVPLPRRVCPKCNGPVQLDFDRYQCDGACASSTVHRYIGKLDGIVRAHDTGMLNILEHKTEKRGGKANLPQAWAVRPQVSLYIWAAQLVYKEPFDQIILDVLTRQSPAGKEPPNFMRQNLQRTKKQQEDAVANIVWVADQIEQMVATYGDAEVWPFDGEQCAPNNGLCDFHKLHIIGRDEFTLQNDYQPAEEYLTL